jgi:hypothetical protein
MPTALPVAELTLYGAMIANRIQDGIESVARHFFFPFLADFLLSLHPECVNRKENASTFFANANCLLSGSIQRLGGPSGSERLGAGQVH